MKTTMRDKVCQLIGKYEEKEQQALFNVAGGSFRTMLGKTPTKEQETASKEASIYHWIQEDLKQLLDEDDNKARGAIGCYIVLTEYDDDGHMICAKMARVDGSVIKENVYYTLKNGEFLECEP